jgi:hypothetical protein
VHAQDVAEQRVTRLEPEPAQIRDVTHQPLNLDVRLRSARPGLRNRPLDTVHGGDLPSPRRQKHGVSSGPAADLERSARLKPDLGIERLLEDRRTRSLLPRGEADPVEQLKQQHALSSWLG